jgi:hypothetical protein
MTAEARRQDVVAKIAAEARASRITQERASPHLALEELLQRRPHTMTEIGGMYPKRPPFGSHLGEVDQMKVTTPDAPIVAIRLEMVEDMLKVAEIHTAILVMRTRAQAMLVLEVVEEVSPLVREMDRKTSVLQREKIRHLTPKVA